MSWQLLVCSVSIATNELRLMQWRLKELHYQLRQMKIKSTYFQITTTPPLHLSVCYASALACAVGRFFFILFFKNVRGVFSFFTFKNKTICYN